MNKRAIIILVTVMALGATSIFGVILTKSPKPTPTVAAQKSLEDTSTGLKLSYTEPLQSRDLTKEDKKDKFIGRLTSSEPPMLVSIRYEDNLRLAASLSRQEPLAMLLNNAAKAYPKRFADYKLLNERRLQVKDKEASELNFSYQGPSQQTVRQRNLIILVNDNLAVYITVQATAADFENLNQLYFDSIFNSLTFKKGEPQ